MKWYSILGLEASDDDKMILKAEVPPDSPWFDGHFPENPILPGIAQLEMAIDAIRLLVNGIYRLQDSERSVLNGLYGPTKS